MFIPSYETDYVIVANVISPIIIKIWVARLLRLCKNIAEAEEATGLAPIAEPAYRGYSQRPSDPVLGPERTARINEQKAIERNNCYPSGMHSIEGVDP